MQLTLSCYSVFNVLFVLLTYGEIRYKINFNHHKNVIFEILNLVLMLSSDGMNKFVFYSIESSCLKDRRYTGEHSIVLTKLSQSKKYRFEFLKAVYSKDSEQLFEYLESQILSSLKELSKRMNSKSKKMI